MRRVFLFQLCQFCPQKSRPSGRVKRRRPIFPWGYPHSIVRAEELNDRVRDGNGCTLFAIITGSPAHTGGSLDMVYITTRIISCQYFFVTSTKLVYFHTQCMGYPRAAQSLVTQEIVHL